MTTQKTARKLIVQVDAPAVHRVLPTHELNARRRRKQHDPLAAPLRPKPAQTAPQELSERP